MKCDALTDVSEKKDEMTQEEASTARVTKIVACMPCVRHARSLEVVL
jgi:hypothetical protein